MSTADLKSATDEVLAILKTDELNDNERKREIEGIVDRLTDETFNAMTIMAQQLVDYSPEDADEYRGEQREEIIDVNVELDESESDDGGASQGESDLEQEPVHQGEAIEMIQNEESDDESKEEKKKGHIEKGQDIIDFGQIDAHWLKRTLGNKFPDSMAEEIQELEVRIMKILSLENPRDCEKRLFAVLGVEHFELIRILVKNKSSIFFASRLQQA